MHKNKILPKNVHQRDVVKFARSLSMLKKVAVFQVHDVATHNAEQSYTVTDALH